MYHNGPRYRETPMTSGLLYQHMSNHYRRILNAKPAVDTSTPQSFKPRISQASHPGRYQLNSHDRLRTGSCNDLALIDRILETDEYSPSDVCRRQWSAASRRKLSGEEQRVNQMGNSRKSSERSIGIGYLRSKEEKKRVKGGDVMEMHKQQFQSYQSHLDFWPRILKSNATSKLKDMRVYYPPRRKTGFEKEQWAQSSSDREEERQCNCSGVCTCGAAVEAEGGIGSKEPSQTSSRDSAYNGGTSSDPESRSPTPCQQKASKNAETQTELLSHRRQSVGRKKASNREATAASTATASGGGDGVGELAYTKFIHDLTAEIVMKGHVSDKSMSKIINNHVTANLALLDKEKMMIEVTRLRKELGMESDDSRSPSPSYLETPSWLPTTASTGEAKTPKSWTTSYMKLMGLKQNTMLERNKVTNCESARDSADGDGVRLGSRSGEPPSVSFSARTVAEDDSDGESEASSVDVESTIKEAVRGQVDDWRDSDLEDDSEESVEVPSSNYDEDDFDE